MTAVSLAKRFSIGLVTVGAIAGCTVGPNYQRPAVNTPAEFALAAAGASTQPTAGVANLKLWWQTFNDAELDDLVERASRANLDLVLATQRIVESRAQRGIVAGDYYPSVDANGSYRRSESSLNSATSGAAFGAPRGTSLWQAGFDATWELDVFGGVRRSVQAADADTDSFVEARRDVLLTLVGDVARVYVELRGAQNEIRVVQQNVDAQTQTLELTRTRARAGLISDLDVARSEAQVATTASRIPTLQSQARRSLHRLAVLLGEPPATLVAELDAPDRPLPTADANVPVGLPSELMLRRPDVRRAERELAAATARIGVARADLFPRFSLVGSLGVESDKLPNLPEGHSAFWTVGPSVSFPIFNFGRLRSNVAVLGSRARQTLARFEQVVLTSMEDVENALVNLDRERARRVTLRQSVEANQRAVQISSTLYDQGLTDFINVLDAQRTLFEAQDQLIQSETFVSSDLIALYKSLGGGWEAFEHS